MYTYQWEQFLILDIEIICSIKKLDFLYSTGKNLGIEKCWNCKQSKAKQSKAKSKTPKQNREGMHGHTIFGVGRYKRTTAVKQRYSYNQFISHSLYFYPISIIIHIYKNSLSF